MYHLRQQHADRLREPSPGEIERWITEPRFRAFLEDVGGDPGKAMRLYDWNVRVSAAFLEALSYGEVVLRNAIDAQFRPLDHGEAARSCWLTDPGLVNDRSLQRATEAIANIERMGKEPTRARLVSNLSFGFWRTLFDRHYKRLWVSNLHRGFPNGTGDRAEVAQLMARLNPFRNRIAHHESIVHARIERRHADLIALVRLIDLDAGMWLEARSAVGAILAARPR